MTVEDQIRDALDAYAQAIRPDRSAWEHVRDRLEAPRRPPRPKRPARLVAAGSLAAAAVIAVSLAVWMTTSTTRHVTTEAATTKPPDEVVASRLSSGAIVALGSSDGALRAVVDVPDQTFGVDHVAASPDGQWIYFDRPSTLSSRCYLPALQRVAAEGGAPTRITLGLDGTPSPDGKTVAFLRNAAADGCANNYDVMIRDLGHRRERIVAAAATQGTVLSWSANSHELLYTSGTNLPSTTIVDLRNGTTRPLRGLAANAPVLGWLGSSNRVAAIERQPSGAPARVVTVDPTTGATHALFDLPGTGIESWSVDPSGQHVVFVGSPSPGANGITGFRWDVGDAAPRNIFSGILNVAWLPPRSGAVRLVECPGTQHVDASTSTDGLPAAESHTDDLKRVAAVLQSDGPRIRHDYANVRSLRIGPGGGYVWDRASSGSIVVRRVANYAIIVRLNRASACPTGGALHHSDEGIGLTFVAPAR